MPRAFFGIPVSEPTQRVLTRTREAFLHEDPSWAGEKWVDAANLHVTLVFLGQLADTDLDRAARLAADALLDIPAYDLHLDALRAVPRPDAASMLWVVPLAGEGPTRDIATRIAAACAHLGREPERRSFTTHVTICRSRRPAPIAPPALAVALERLREDPPAATVSVAAVTLYTSTLTRRGPVYDRHAVIHLAG